MIDMVLKCLSRSVKSSGLGSIIHLKVITFLLTGSSLRARANARELFIEFAVAFSLSMVPRGGRLPDASSQILLGHARANLINESISRLKQKNSVLLSSNL